MSRRAALAAVLAACAGMAGGTSNAHPTDGQLLFECRQAGTTIRLTGSAAGELSLELGPGPESVILRWQEVREGRVTGQDGGHQAHLRLVAGDSMFVLFEGRNGNMTDDPGRTYAGATGQSNGKDFRIECERDALNAALADNVRLWAERAGVAPPQVEEEGSEFDGWY